MGAVVSRSSSATAKPSAPGNHRAPSADSQGVCTDPLVAAAARTAARYRNLDDFDVANNIWHANDGAALEDPLSIDPAIGEGAVRLIDARFLIALAKANGRLPRRQDLPESAFLSLSWLRRMPEGYMPTDLRVLCVSHM